MANAIHPRQPVEQRVAPQEPRGAVKYWYSKPLCHNIWFGTTELGTILHQKSNPRKWHGKVVLVLAKGIIKTGYALNMVIASTQLVAGIAFGIPFFVSANVIYKGRRFEKKISSYLGNVFKIISLQNSFLKKGIYPNKHAQNAYLNHYFRLKESAHQIYWWDYAHHNRDVAEPEPIQRLENFFQENSAKICKDIVNGAARDLSLQNFHYRNHNSFLNFIQEQGYNFRDLGSPRYSQSAVILFHQYLLEEMAQNLNINHQQALELLMDNLNFPGSPIDQNDFNGNDIVWDLRRLEIREIRNPFQAYGENEHDRLFKAYQNKLKAFIVDAYMDLYDQPDFLRMLSLDHEADAALIDGRERLENSLAVPQLAHYSVLKEIEKEIECPQEFVAAELHIYNNRFQLLKEAQEMLKQLAANEKQTLIHKLLKLGSYDVHAQGLDKARADLIQTLFNKIGELAKPLHQGNLLIQKVVNVELLQAGRVHEAFDAQNLFQGACNEAQAKIDARV